MVEHYPLQTETTVANIPLASTEKTIIKLLPFPDIHVGIYFCKIKLTKLKLNLENNLIRAHAMYNKDSDEKKTAACPNTKDRQTSQNAINFHRDEFFPTSVKGRKTTFNSNFARGGQNEQRAKQVRSNCKLLAAGGVVVAVKSNWR